MDLANKIGLQGIQGADDFEQLARDPKLTPHRQAWLTVLRSRVLAMHGHRSEAIAAMHEAVHQEAAGDASNSWLIQAARDMMSLDRADLTIEYCREVLRSKEASESQVRDSLQVVGRAIYNPQQHDPASVILKVGPETLKLWNDICAESQHDEARAFCRRETVFVALSYGSLRDAVESMSALQYADGRQLRDTFWLALFELAVIGRREHIIDTLAALRCFFKFFGSGLDAKPVFRGPVYCLAADCFLRQGRDALAHVAYRFATDEGIWEPATVDTQSPLFMTLWQHCKPIVDELAQRFEHQARMPRLPDASAVSASISIPSVRSEIIAACDTVLDRSLSDPAACIAMYTRPPLAGLDPFERMEECKWVRTHSFACGISLSDTPLGGALDWYDTLWGILYWNLYQPPALPDAIRADLHEACRVAYVEKNVSKASEAFIQVTADIAEQLQIDDRIRALCVVACAAHRFGCSGTGERILTSVVRIADGFGSHPMERLRILGMACQFLVFSGGYSDFPRLLTSIARDAYAQCISLKANAPGYSDRDRGQLISISWDLKLVLLRSGDA